MEENTIYNLLIITCLLAIIIVTIFIFTNKQTEPFTELYFENHQSLPQHLELNQDYPFQFTIHNLENKPLKYYYEVSLDLDHHRQILKQAQITLNHDQHQTFTESFHVDQPFTQGKITVTLLTKHQSIHFWIQPK